MCILSYIICIAATSRLWSCVDCGHVSDSVLDTRVTQPLHPLLAVGWAMSWAWPFPVY